MIRREFIAGLGGAAAGPVNILKLNLTLDRRASRRSQPL
jgi:hypothetical protein